MKNSLRLLLLLLSLCVFNYTCGSSIVESGSGTETIGGKLVDPDDKVVKGVPVTAISVDTSISDKAYFAETDGNGDFLITHIPRGIYSISSVKEDSTLFVFLDSVEYADSSKILDLDTIVMTAPGSVSGKVLVNGKPEVGVSIFVAGTMLSAFCDDSGNYLFDKMAEGKYTLYFSKFEYLTEKVSGIEVESNKETVVLTQNLLHNPDKFPESPQNVSGVYDIESGLLSLSWDEVNVSDFLRYDIFRKKTGENDFELIHSLSDINCVDTVYHDLLDTSSGSCYYKLKTVDTDENKSPYSSTISIETVSPTHVRTMFTWTLLPDKNDTITSEDTVRLAIKYSNKLRKNSKIQWFINTDTVRAIDVDSKKGVDTIHYLFTDTGLHKVYIEAVDFTGDIWRDSCFVSVEKGIIPTNVWKTIPDLNEARRFCGAVSVGDAIYAIGGAKDLLVSDPPIQTALSSVEKYVPGESKWVSVSEMEKPRFQVATVAVGSLIYIIGGMNTDEEFSTIEIYDTEKKRWNESFAMPLVRFGHSACVMGDSIFIIGGVEKVNSGYSITADIDVYHPGNKTFTHMGKTNTPRTNHQSVMLKEKIVILGGNSAVSMGGAINSVEEYNPVNNTIVYLAYMPDNCLHFGAIVMDDKIYVVGGRLSITNNEFLANLNVFDSDGNKWTEKRSMSSKRHSFSIAVLNNIMYVVGGSNQGAPQLGQLGSVLKYYP